MASYRVVLIPQKRWAEGEIEPRDVTGHAQGCVFEGGISEPCSRREARAWGARGYLHGTVEQMEPIIQKIQRGELPRLPTEEELDALEVPEGFGEDVPTHNDRIKEMRELGYNPYDLLSKPNGEQTLKLYYVFTEGEEVLEGLLTEEDDTEEDDTEEGDAKDSGDLPSKEKEEDDN